MLRRSIPIMLLLVLAFLIVFPTFAQDVTPEPAATAVVTPAPAERSLFSAATLGELLLFLGLSAFAGGGIVAILLSFLGRKEVRDRVEDARNSWAPEQQELLAKFTDLFERTSSGILDFLKAVQDGKPNEPLALLSATEGPALAKQSDLDMLAKQVNLHDKYLHGTSKMENPYLTEEDARAILDAARQAPRQ